MIHYTESYEIGWPYTFYVRTDDRDYSEQFPERRELSIGQFLSRTDVDSQSMDIDYGDLAFDIAIALEIMFFVTFTCEFFLRRRARSK